MKIKEMAIKAGVRTVGSALAVGIAIGADKVAPASISPVIKNGLLIALGAIVPEFIPSKGGKESIASAAGAGLSAIAQRDLLTHFMPSLASVNGIVSGVLNGLPETISVDEVSGVGESTSNRNIMGVIQD